MNIIKKIFSTKAMRLKWARDFVANSNILKKGEGLLESKEVREYYERSFPLTKQIPQDGRTKRWVLPIDVCTRGIERAERALDVLEKEVGMTLFRRVDEDPRNGIVFIDGYANKGYVDLGNGERKLKVDKSCKGNVSRFPMDASIYFSSKPKSPHTLKGLYFVHIGSHFLPEGEADYSGDNDPKRHVMAMHELAHVLGLFSHYGDFDEKGSVIGGGAFAALRLIYQNDAGTPFEELEFTFS